MKSFYYVSFYIYHLLLISNFAWACDNEAHLHFSDESLSDNDSINQRRLSGSMVAECGFIPPSTEEMEEDTMQMKAWMAKQKTQSVFARSDQLYTIPVYFHVIQTSSSSGIVPDTRIGEYISYLNNAYKGSSAPFTFVSKGVTRTIRSDWDKCNNYDTEIAIKTLLKVGGADTLNVYICSAMFTKKGAPLTGFATSPYAKSGIDVRDGVVIDNSSSIGRLNTLIHEVGHFLGLLHTFGDNTCNANSKGDLVADTPQHISRASTVNCNSDPSTWDTCPLLPGIDPIDNYMTYTNNNSCRTRFTSGQNTRMLAQYELYRLPKSPLPAPTPVAPRPVPRPTPLAPRPVPTASRPTPIAPRPVPTVPRPTPIASRPVTQPTPDGLPPVPQQTPVVPLPTGHRPTIFSPRPPTQPAPLARRQPIFAPRAIQPTPMTALNTSCAAILAKCNNTTMCCSGFCKPSRGVFSKILGGRCT